MAGICNAICSSASTAENTWSGWILIDKEVPAPMEKTFLNPATNKQWRIEIDGHTIRTCLNGGKVKEILCDSAFQVKSKAASAMMGQMRKGFVYQNPDAAVGQARCHRFVGKDSNGFMPSESGCRCWAGAVPSVCRQGQQRLYALGCRPHTG